MKKTGGTLYWRDISGNTIAETNLSGANQSEYVFFGGRRLTRIDSSGNVYYYLVDQIGSTRAVVNSSGTLCYDSEFTPYGYEFLPTGINSCPQNYKFTGYERDSETGLDYAMNRYYNSRMGRFMSPDPVGIASAALGSPQSLHRYAYVLNNPLIGIDPFGLECVFLNGAGNLVEDVEATSEDDSNNNSTACTGNGGLYFDGNNEVNTLNSTQDNGNWGNFDIDLDSNWVGLTNDQGLPEQAACIGGACSYGSLEDMGADYDSAMDSSFHSSAHGPGFSRLDFRLVNHLNSLACGFMSAGVSVGDSGKEFGDKVVTAAEVNGLAAALTGNEPAALGAVAIGSVGKGYGYALDGYGAFWKGMKYLGGCSAYGR